MTTPAAPTRSRRAPVLVVLLALVLGSLGLAGTAYGAGLTGKQVKKIATKVVKKQAPKLSVKHAKTADSAKTAGSATTAGTAGNATNLGGLPATTYLDRIIWSSTTTETDLDGTVTTQVLNPNTITVPAGVGHVRIDATLGLPAGSGTNVTMWISRGPCTASGTDYDNRQYGNNDNQSSISLTRVLPVDADDHTFRMCALSGSDATVMNRAMAIQAVALAG